MKKLNPSPMILAGLLLVSQPVFAQHGVGTQGGGEEQCKSGQCELRDLVDIGTCKWVRGRNVAKREDIQSFFTKLSAVNPYFSIILKKELQSIDFCFTLADLRRPVADEDPGVTIYKEEQTSIVGVRLLEDKAVYVNQPGFENLSPRSKPMFYIHETMHSFIDFKFVRHNPLLRDFINNVTTIMDGAVVTTDDLSMWFTRTKVNFPTWNRSEVDHFEPGLFQFLTSNSEERQAMIENGFQITELDKVDRLRSLGLRDTDLKTINATTSMGGENALAFICKDQNEALLDKIILQGEAAIQRLYSVCTAVYNTVTGTSFEKKLYGHSSLNQPIKALLNAMNTAQYSMLNDEIAVNSGFSEISATPKSAGRKRLVVNIRAILSSDDPNLSFNARYFFDRVRDAAERFEFNEFLQTISFPDLVQALKPTRHFAAIDQLSTTPEKKKAAKEQIQAILKSFTKAFLRTVENANPDAGEDLTEKLKQENL